MGNSKYGKRKPIYFYKWIVIIRYKFIKINNNRRNLHGNIYQIMSGAAARTGILRNKGYRKL